MNEVTVVFRSVADIRDFVSIANRQPYAIRLECGSAIFNGKSILSLFCVSLGSPLRLSTQQGDDCADFLAAIRPYCQEMPLSV